MSGQTRFSILGPGHIAEKVATAAASLRGRGLTLRAVASRDQGRAEPFARRFGFERAFGSYEALAADPETDLVYVATPNTLHARHVQLCLQAGKHVICEKPFADNEHDAAAVFALARSLGLFCCEAMWMRFLPAHRRVRELVASGAIGEPRLLQASFAVPVSGKERLIRPELGGGALLDLGIYPVAFALMQFGLDFEETDGVSLPAPTGVDDQTSFSMRWADGRLASLSCSMTAADGAWGRVAGTTGRIELPQLTRCERIALVRHSDGSTETMDFPFDCNGYEYELASAASAVAAGLVEPPEMPHAATLAALRVCDALRARCAAAAALLSK